MTTQCLTRLLVPLDGSDLGAATIPHLRALACVESELILLHVIATDVPTDHPAPLRSVEAARQWLRSVAAELADVTPRVRVLVREGPAADEIVRVAETERVDLVVMPTRSPGASHAPRIGSIASRVAQASPVPVMLIHAQHGTLPLTVDQCARYHRVIVPLDGSARAAEALPVAVRLASRRNLPVRLLYAAPDAPPARIRRALATEAARMRALGLDCGADIVRGATVPAILAAVGPGDIIVMTSHGTGGVRHWLMGGIAEKVVALARTPVMLVPVSERRPLARPVEAAEPAGTPARRAAERLPAITVAMGS